MSESDATGAESGLCAPAPVAEPIEPLVWYEGGTYCRSPKDLAVCTKCFGVVPVWFKERHFRWHEERND